MHFSAKALLLLASLAGQVTQVSSHGVEVRYCQTNSGVLRILIEHWHGALSSASDAGTMTIRDVNGSSQTLYPNGILNNQSSSSIGAAADCVNGISTQSSTCNDSRSGTNNWVYYDFANDCSLATPPQYTCLLYTSPSPRGRG